MVKALHLSDPIAVVNADMVTNTSMISVRISRGGGGSTRTHYKLYVKFETDFVDTKLRIV